MNKKESNRQALTPPLGGGREGLYIKPAIEVIEMEATEVMAQTGGTFSGNSIAGPTIDRSGGNQPGWDNPWGE